MVHFSHCACAHRKRLPLVLNFEVWHRLPLTFVYSCSKWARSAKMSFDGSRGPPNIEGMTSLKVDNLTYRTTIEDLKRVFQKHGDVGDVYIPRDPRNHESRGFAFVRFFEKRDAEDAMDTVDGMVLDGREIRVQNAKYGRPASDYRPRATRGRHGGGGGNGGGSRYRR